MDQLGPDLVRFQISIGYSDLQPEVCIDKDPRSVRYSNPRSYSTVTVNKLHHSRKAFDL